MRALFIDDNAMNREVVKCMLCAADIVMMEADSAEVGLGLIDADCFDLVLMDLRMPGMDGLTAVRIIRARGDAKAEVPIIVVTADSGQDVRAQALAAGADGFLHKPVQMQLLFDTIGRAVAGRQGAMLA